MAFENSDVVIDSPLNNFATLNPLNNKMSTFSEGNLEAYSDKSFNGASSGLAYATIAIPQTGKWYCEVMWVSGPQSSHMGVWPDLYGGGYGERFRVLARSDGNIFKNNSSSGVGHDFAGGPYMPSWGHGDIISMLCDADAGILTFYKNGVEVTPTNPFNFLDWDHPDNRSRTFALLANPGVTHSVNFGADPTFGGRKADGGAYADSNGQGQFYYSIAFDNGALALCTKNIPSGPIDVHQDDIPADYFKTVIWRGDNQNGRQIDTDGDGTGTGFQPDLAWVAIRSGPAGVQTITDSLRQAGSMMSPNMAASVNSFDASWRSSYGQITELNSTGFKVNKGGSAWSNFNHSSCEYVAWTWRAAGSPADGQAKIINEDGSNGTISTADLQTNTGANITPDKVSANRKSGFSIVLTTGITTDANHYTIPHGLTKAPEISIFKNLDYDDSWYTRHYATGGLLALDQTWGDSQYPSYWDDKPVDQNIFTLRGNSFQSNSSQRLISYHFHSVAGYSKIGSFYPQNIGTDNSVIHLGFEPAFIMFKQTTGGTWESYHSWLIFDNARRTYNPQTMKHSLWANKSDNEGVRGNGGASTDYAVVDFLSNGFKVKGDYAEISGSNSGRTIFMAFAKNPFNAPTTAK